MKTLAGVSNLFKVNEMQSFKKQINPFDLLNLHIFRERYNQNIKQSKQKR